MENKWKKALTWDSDRWGEVPMQQRKQKPGWSILIGEMCQKTIIWSSAKQHKICEGPWLDQSSDWNPFKHPLRDDDVCPLTVTNPFD